MDGSSLYNTSSSGVVREAKNVLTLSYKISYFPRIYQDSAMKLEVAIFDNH